MTAKDHYYYLRFYPHTANYIDDLIQWNRHCHLDGLSEKEKAILIGKLILDEGNELDSSCTYNMVFSLSEFIQSHKAFYADIYREGLIQTLVDNYYNVLVDMFKQAKEALAESESPKALSEYEEHRRVDDIERARDLYRSLFKIY